MRDTSVPTPAIVDARLIEAPFEVAVREEESRRAQREQTDVSTAGDALGITTSTVETISLREQRRAEKAAEKELKRRAKINAKAEAKASTMSSAKSSARAAASAFATESVTHESTSEVSKKPNDVASPSTPRSTSSFDELMGYSEK